MPINELTPTIQIYIISEFMVPNTFLYPPHTSMPEVSYIIAYTVYNMSIMLSISNAATHAQDQHDLDAIALHHLGRWHFISPHGLGTWPVS